MKTLEINSVAGIERTNSQTKLAELLRQQTCSSIRHTRITSPTVNLKARACGTPVVTYRTGGCPERMDEKRCKIVKKDNTGAHLEAIYEVKKVYGINSERFDKNKKIS